MSYYNMGSYNEIKMVILDLAGTTVDYGSCAPAAALVELFDRYGISLSLEKVRGPMGMHKREHIKALAADEEVAQQWRRVYRRDFNDDDLDKLYREFIPLQLDILEKHGLLIPGTLEAQHYFRSKGIKIGVTTGYSREMADIVLRQMEKQGFEWDVMVSAGDVSRGRPAPWMAITAAQKLGINTPEAVVKIGDTEVDIAAGLNAGMWSVGVIRTGNMLGLTLEEQWALPEWELHGRLEEAQMKMANAGAHDVIGSIAEAPFTLEKINAGLVDREENGSIKASVYWIRLNHALRQKTGLGGSL